MRYHDVRNLRIKGFSLAELIVVVIVLGILAATAVPRFSRGAAGVADSALAGDLAVLRNGIDLYASDHNGSYPSVENFDAQLTQYTDNAGNASPTQDSTHVHGPYLRKIPVLPVGPKGYKSSSAVIDAAKSHAGSVAGAWIYDAKTGQIRANLADRFADYTGKAYNQY